MLQHRRSRKLGLASSTPSVRMSGHSMSGSRNQAVPVEFHNPTMEKKRLTGSWTWELRMLFDLLQNPWMLRILRAHTQQIRKGRQTYLPRNGQGTSSMWMSKDDRIDILRMMGLCGVAPFLRHAYLQGHLRDQHCSQKTSGKWESPGGSPKRWCSR